MIHYKALENHFIVWFSKANQYLILDPVTAEVIKQLDSDKSIDQIQEKLHQTSNIEAVDSREFVEQVQENIYDVLRFGFTDEPESIESFDFESSIEFSFKKIYHINSLSFEIHFSSERDFLLIHPKFQHLEVQNSVDSMDKCIIKCAYHKQLYHLEIDGHYEGHWYYQNLHFLIGRLYMRMLERVHNNQEKDWGAVFHASAVGNNDSCVMMMGESGSGKSTSVALLNASGINCLADDFVPMDKQGRIYPFPAGISIKPGSVELLDEYYPNLKLQETIDLNATKKGLRYIPIFHQNLRQTTECKALIFIKYKASVELTIELLPTQKLFETLIPESWLSDDPKFVSFFMNWLSEIPCYTLTYSDQNKMIAEVNKLLEK